MDSATADKELQELQRLRAEKRIWQIATSLILLVLVISSLLRLRNAVTGLTQDGPTKTAFTNEVSSRLQKNAIPAVEQIGTQAVREIDFQAEVQKLNQRTPELADASLQQMKLLGDNLPKRGQKVLDSTFGEAMKGRESKIRALYPDVKDEQVTNAVTNLTAEAQQQVVEVNDALFSSHQKALNSIVEDLTLIQHSEAANVKGQEPTWEMALLLFDITRADLKALEASSAKDSKTAENAGKPVGGAKK